MAADYKQLTTFLVEKGIEKVSHSQKTYLAHLVGVYRLMETHGCTPEVCRAGMFHSIYGTEQFQGFKLELEQRPQVRDLIGERAERLGYLNCAMDRAAFDVILSQETEPYLFRDRVTGQAVELSRADFDDLCRVHVFDWFEQVARSRLGWNYRRAGYRGMAERLGPDVIRLYDEVFANEPR